MAHRVILQEEDGNGVGIYRDVPVPAVGDRVGSEGDTFRVVTVLHGYGDDFDDVTVVVTADPPVEHRNVFDDYGTD